MATDIKDLIIRLSLENDQLKKELKKTRDETSKTQKKFTSLKDAIKKHWLKVTAIIAGAGLTIKKAFDFVSEFTEFEQATIAMEKQFGKSADEIIRKLREVSDGTISNKDLVLAANRAMALGVTTNLDQMAKLLEIARVRARSMGIDTTQAFDDIVTGIGRQSPLILDNLGIITKGWADEAEAANTAYDKQFILNKVIEDGQKILNDTGEVTLTNAERLQKFSSSIDNLKVTLGEKLAPVLLSVTDKFSNFLSGSAIEKLSTKFAFFVRDVSFGLKIIANKFETWVMKIKFVAQALQFLRESNKSEWGLVIKDLKANLKGVDTYAKIMRENVIQEYYKVTDEIINGNSNVVDSHRKMQESIVTDASEYTQLREQLEKNHLKEIKDLKLKALKFNLITEKELTKIEERELRTRVKNYEKFEGFKKKISDTFVKGFMGGLEDMSSSSHTVFVSIIRSFIDMLAGQLAAWAATELALSFTPPPVGGPQHASGAAALLAAAGTVKVLGNEAVKYIESHPVKLLAEGGRLNAGEVAIVGEKGPEIFKPDVSGTIIPNHQITNNTKILPSVTINVQTERGEEVVEVLNDYFKQFGTSQRGLSL